jgi:hypothetical protein
MFQDIMDELQFFSLVFNFDICGFDMYCTLVARIDRIYRRLPALRKRIVISRVVLLKIKILPVNFQRQCQEGFSGPWVQREKLFLTREKKPGPPWATLLTFPTNTAHITTLTTKFDRCGRFYMVTTDRHTSFSGFTGSNDESNRM